MIYINKGLGLYLGTGKPGTSGSVPDLSDLIQPVMYDGNLAYSPEAMLFKSRTIKLSTDVNPQSANRIKDMLLVLDRLKYKGKPHEDIIMYIDSPGGYVTAGLGIYDTMQAIKSDVVTVCTGLAASMGSLLLMGGAPGKRYALPNSTIMVHQLSAGSLGKLHEINVSTEHFNTQMDKLAQIYINHMPKDDDGLIDRWGGDTQEESYSAITPEPMELGRVKSWLKRWAEKDRYMSAEQALAWGHIDKIIGNLPGNNDTESLDDIIKPK